jgi:hypothetical protein
VDIAAESRRSHGLTAAKGDEVSDVDVGEVPFFFVVVVEAGSDPGDAADGSPVVLSEQAVSVSASAATTRSMRFNELSPEIT